MKINFCNRSAAEQYKSFLVQQFFKNAAEVEGEQPSSLPAGSETLCVTQRRTAKRVRKAIAFRGRANKTALPCNDLE
jgi:hypothetical protein